MVNLMRAMAFSFFAFIILNSHTYAVSSYSHTVSASCAARSTRQLPLSLRLKGGDDDEVILANAVPPNPRKIFVGNIPPKANEEDLKTLFANLGGVVGVEIKHTSKGRPKGYAMVEFDEPEKASAAVSTMSGTMLQHRVIILRPDVGYDPAVVAEKQAKREAAATAREAYMASLPETVAGEKVEAMRRQQIGGPDYWPRCPPACRVYVGNIKFGTRWEDLREHLMQAGRVVFGRIIKQPFDNPDGSITYRSRGFAIVQFATPEEAGHAVETLNQSQLNGRPIYVRPDTSRISKGSTRRAPAANKPAAAAAPAPAAAAAAPAVATPAAAS